MVQRTSEKISEMDALALPSSVAVIPVTDGANSYKLPVGALVPAVDIRQHGYGTTDDSVAMAAALAAAGVGGTVIIPAGITVTIDNITLTSRKISGRGTLKWKAGSTNPMLTLAGTSPCLEGITIDGESLNHSTTVAVVTSSAVQPRFENLIIKNFRYKFFLSDAVNSPGGQVTGCYVYNCAQVTDSDIFGVRSARWSFIQCDFEHVVGLGHMIRLGQYLVAVGTPVNDCRVIGCSFYDSVECAVVCETLTQDCIIDGCNFRDCADGGIKCEAVAIELVKNITINGCTFHNVTSATNAPFQWGVAGTFTNNRCYDSNGGFDLQAASVVEGNYLENCGAVGFPSISVGSGATGACVIRGNMIVSVPTGVAGIDVAAANAIVEGNWVERAAGGAMTDGIVIRGGTTRVAGNTVKNVGGRAIRAFGGLNSIEGNVLVGSATAITMDSTFTTSKVTGNNISTFSVAAYSFTSNSSFRSVVLKDNPGAAVPSFDETLASGVIFVGLSHCQIALETEGAGATDDLDKIDATDAFVGQVVILHDNSSTRDVTVKHNTNNIFLTGAADFAMANSSHHIALMWSGTRWNELFRSTS